MKFDSEIYNKVYHTTEPDSGNAGSAGGVVEPQPKRNENGETVTDEPKQTATDVNINLNVTTGETTSGEAGEAGEAGEVNESGDE